MRMQTMHEPGAAVAPWLSSGLCNVCACTLTNLLTAGYPPHEAFDNWARLATCTQIAAQGCVKRWDTPTVASLPSEAGSGHDTPNVCCCCKPLNMLVSNQTCKLAVHVTLLRLLLLTEHA
jgi:hypothetical protein